MSLTRDMPAFGGTKLYIRIIAQISDASWDVVIAAPFLRAGYFTLTQLIPKMRRTWVPNGNKNFHLKHWHIHGATQEEIDKIAAPYLDLNYEVIADSLDKDVDWDFGNENIVNCNNNNK
jgi:hypothetical protein